MKAKITKNVQLKLPPEMLGPTSKIKQVVIEEQFDNFDEWALNDIMGPALDIKYLMKERE